MSKIALSMYFTVAQLAYVSYTPTSGLEMIWYFPEDAPTPSQIIVELQNLIVNTQAVSELGFGDPVGSYLSSRGNGKLRSFFGLNSHLTPKEGTIDPGQPIVAVEENKIMLGQLDSLFGSSVQLGDFLRLRLNASKVVSEPGLVAVSVDEASALVYQHSDAHSVVPIFAGGNAADIEVTTEAEIVNFVDYPQMAQVDVISALGTPLASDTFEIPALSSRPVRSTLILPKGGTLQVGWLHVEGCRCGVTSEWNVLRHRQCPGADQPCQEKETEGTAGVTSSTPDNAFIIPQFGAPGSGGKPSFAAVNGSPDSTGHVRIVLLDMGSPPQPIGDPVDIEVPPMNHTSRFIEELFPGLDQEFTGIISSDVPIGATFINNNPNGFPQSSIDPVPVGAERLLPTMPDWIESP